MYTDKKWKSINQNTTRASLPLRFSRYQLIVASSFEKDRFIMMWNYMTNWLSTPWWWWRGDSTLTSDPFISRSDLTFFVPWSWITQGNTTVWSGFTVKFSLCVNIFNSAATTKIQNLDNHQNHQLYILTKIFYQLDNLS